MQLIDFCDFQRLEITEMSWKYMISASVGPLVHVRCLGCMPHIVYLIAPRNVYFQVASLYVKEVFLLNLSFEWQLVLVLWDRAPKD